MFLLFYTLIIWTIFALLFTWYQTAKTRKTEKILEVIIAFPIVVTTWAFVLCSLPFVAFWKIIRNVIKGVREDVWQKHNFKHFMRIGNIYFVYDEKAKLWLNKFFIIRIIKGD